MGKNLKGKITLLNVYTRALKVSEVIGNYQFHILP